MLRFFTDMFMKSACKNIIKKNSLLSLFNIQDSEKESEKGMDEEVNQDSKAAGFITL